MAGMNGNRNGNGNGGRGSAERPTAIVKPGEEEMTPQKRVEILFMKASQRLDKMVPAHMSAERLWRLALAAMSRDPKLCEATPQSILLSTMQCAALGLEPNTALQQAYLVPYKNKKRVKEGNAWKDVYTPEAQLIIGYRGLILLAEQASIVSGIKAEVVYDKDQYRPILEGGVFVHEPYQKGDPGPMVAAYCRWIASNGQREYLPMSRFELEKWRDRFAQRDYNNPKELKKYQPWTTDFEAMCRKTTVRQASAFWPMATERSEKLRTALAIDERSEGGSGPDFRLGLPENMQDALHDIPELQGSMEYEPEPSYPVEDDDESNAATTTAPIPEVTSTPARERTAQRARAAKEDDGTLSAEQEARAFGNNKGGTTREPGKD